MKRWIATIASLLMLCSLSAIAADTIRNDQAVPEFFPLLEKYKKAEAMSKWPALSPPAQERVAGYHKLARTKPELGERVVASGISGVILGYAEINEVAAFVAEYRRSGKTAKSVPLPYANFKGAADKFPEATAYLANELETSKKLDNQVNAVLRLVADQYKRESADLQKQIVDLDRQIEQLDRQIEQLDRILKSLDRILILTK